MTLARVLALAAALALGGCDFAPLYVAPHVGLPRLLSKIRRWGAPAIAATTGGVCSTITGSTISRRWWTQPIPT